MLIFFNIFYSRTFFFILLLFLRTWHFFSGRADSPPLRGGLWILSPLDLKMLSCFAVITDNGNLIAKIIENCSVCTYTR